MLTVADIRDFETAVAEYAERKPFSKMVFERIEQEYAGVQQVCADGLGRTIEASKIDNLVAEVIREAGYDEREAYGLAIAIWDKFKK